MSAKRKRTRTATDARNTAALLELTPLERQLVHAAMLQSMIAGTFELAYVLARQGMTLDAMLIDYDIQAAGTDQPECVSACARTVIKAAANAAGRNMPYDLAFVVLMQRVHSHMEAMLQETALQMHSQ